MKYIRANSLKRLFSLKRSSRQDIVFTNEEEKNNENSKVVQEQEHSPRPSWKCFSFEEIFDATNGFRPGLLHLHCNLLNSTHVFCN